MRIGTRGSALALAQAGLVAAALGECEVVPVSTSADRGGPGEDKSRWVRELEDALLGESIDLAVHSAKDVPGELASGLELMGAPAAAAREDVVCGADGLDALAAGARVGTSSLRREAQLRSTREDLEVVRIGGNVDTRLRKLAEGELDAIVIARAGLQRLGREREVGAVLDPERFVPAPGQGILVLEGRAGDERTRAAARAIADRPTCACLSAERSLAAELQAGCHTPLGACATPAGPGLLRLRAWVGLPDGSAWMLDERSGELEEPEALACDLAGRLKLVGATEMLARAEEMAGVADA